MNAAARNQEAEVEGGLLFSVSTLLLQQAKRLLQQINHAYAMLNRVELELAMELGGNPEVHRR